MPALCKGGPHPISAHNLLVFFMEPSVGGSLRPPADSRPPRPDSQRFEVTGLPL
jgi:hypothetical protein